MQIPAQIAASQLGVHLQSRPQVQQLGKKPSSSRQKLAQFGFLVAPLLVVKMLTEPAIVTWAQSHTAPLRRPSLGAASAARNGFPSPHDQAVEDTQRGRFLTAFTDIEAIGILSNSSVGFLVDPGQMRKTPRTDGRRC